MSCSRSPRLSARAVLFDWDGTLLNSATADTRAYLAMFAGLGIRWTAEELAQNYHPDWYRVYEAAKIERSRWPQADRLWRQAYALESPRLLSGARAILGGLAKRFILGIVTSGDGVRVRQQLITLRVATLFQVCICAEDCEFRKPHPGPLRLALARLGILGKDAVYVGDAGPDMVMAQRAGVRAIGIFGSFPTADALRAARPAVLLKSLKSLPRHLVPLCTGVSRDGRNARLVAARIKETAKPTKRAPAQKRGLRSGA